MCQREKRHWRPLFIAIFVGVIGAYACGGSANSSSQSPLDIASDASPGDLPETTDASPGDAYDVEATEGVPPLNSCAEDLGCIDLLHPGPCENAICRLPEGLCVLQLLPDDTVCDDGDRCTTSDACATGVCGGEAVLCDDKNPCTIDACDSAEGCQFDPDTGALCEDNNPCTEHAFCVEGLCVGEDNSCPCTEDADCSPFDDDDACNGTMACVEGRCEIASSGATTCDSSSDTACRRNTCDAGTGLCFPTDVAAGEGCDDGDACTTQDVCVSGLCRGFGTETCDDGNACTTDSCDPDLGCQHVANNLPCDDGDRCTIGDHCSFGICSPVVNVCSCGSDEDCPASAASSPCYGEYKCGKDDKCHLEIASALSCPTDSPGSCGTWTCDETLGACVQHSLPNDTPCNDQDACTTEDRCVFGVCVGVGALECEDGEPCSFNTCHPEWGCVFDVEAANGRDCDDGNFCTSGEQCLHGQCFGAESTCECFEDEDCGEHDDDDPCTGTYACQDNRCVVVPETVVVCATLFSNPCVTSACNPGTGLCEATLMADGTACEDQDACTVDDRCVGGTCVAGEDRECLTEDPCQQGYCNSAIGCVFVPASGPCTDGDPCTTGDLCSGGSCVGTLEPSCEDGDPCTVDSCDPEIGCVHELAFMSCDDGSPCTVFDVCTVDGCQGDPRNCDDGDPCTTDTCDALLGCLHLAYEGPCDDGNACTVGDECVAGLCVPGAPCVVDSALDCAAFDDGDRCNAVGVKIVVA